jgi:hypothetical protein
MLIAAIGGLAKKPLALSAKPSALAQEISASA